MDPGYPTSLPALEVSRFQTVTEAETALARWVESADPHFGNSYAWDRVVRREAEVWRLHAPCWFSEATFREAERRMELPVEPVGSFGRCECGQGCGLWERP